MRTITFNCEIITPMFLAGADSSIPELRPPSIKGALRFWWRAMHGEMSIPDLKKAETMIFGGGGEDARRSRVSLSIKPLQLITNNTLRAKNIEMPSPTKDNPDRTIKADLFRYLAYGAHEREYIDCGSTFDLTFRFVDPVSINDEILMPLKMLSFIGGLGAKSRNGYGCFRILSCSDKSVDLSGTPIDIIKQKFRGSISCYTAFSTSSKLFMTKNEYRDWKSAFETVGAAYIKGRRSIENAHHYVKRAYLSTPITQSKEFQWHGERHAKQYFIGVTKADCGTYSGWIMFLPYQHYHNGENNEYGVATSLMNDKLKNYLKEVL